MKKVLLSLMFVGLCSTAFAQSGYQRPRPHHPMPEPTGLVELATVAVGLGAYAVRRRKASR